MTKILLILYLLKTFKEYINILLYNQSNNYLLIIFILHSFKEYDTIKRLFINFIQQFYTVYLL